MSTRRGRGVHLERCYKLAAILARGESLDRKRIAAELGITEANADRHLREIRRVMNVSAVSGRDKLTHVRAARSTHMQISDATVVAACFGASLSQLFRETAFEHRLRDVVAHVLTNVRDVPKFNEHERQFIFIPGGGERALRRDRGDTLATIVDAILQRVVVRLAYTRFRGKTEAVRMQPLSLALHEHQLYLLGFVDGEIRNVRFARITKVHATSEHFEYPSLDKYDPRLIFSDSLGVFIRDEPERSISVRDVMIRLSPKWASYVETHRWHESQKHHVDGRGVVLEMHVRTCPQLEQLILGFGEDAEVLAPPDLRDRVKARLRETVKRYKPRRRSATKAQRSR